MGAIKISETSKNSSYIGFGLVLVALAIFLSLTGCSGKSNPRVLYLGELLSENSRCSMELDKYSEGTMAKNGILEISLDEKEETKKESVDARPSILTIWSLGFLVGGIFTAMLLGYSLKDAVIGLGFISMKATYVSFNWIIWFYGLLLSKEEMKRIIGDDITKGCTGGGTF